MNEGQQPEWQPISMLPLMTDLIDQSLGDARDMLGTVQEGLGKPHVFNDETVDRIIALYTETLDLSGVYEQQLQRWSAETPAPEELAEITRLLALLPELRHLSEAIVDMAGKIRTGTIDRIMEISDLELGLRALSGKGFTDT